MDSLDLEHLKQRMHHAWIAQLHDPSRLEAYLDAASEFVAADMHALADQLAAEALLQSLEIPWQT